MTNHRKATAALTKVKAELQKKSARATAKKRLRKPLSAYNFFFQIVRDRLVQGNTSMHFTQAEVDQTRSSSLPRDPSHRRTHGKIGFQELARTVGRRWKVLESQYKEMFVERAKQEKKRFERELDLIAKIDQQGDESTKLEHGEQEDDHSPPHTTSSERKRDTISVKRDALPLQYSPPASMLPSSMFVLSEGQDHEQTQVQTTAKEKEQERKEGMLLVLPTTKSLERNFSRSSSSLQDLHWATTRLNTFDSSSRVSALSAAADASSACNNMMNAGDSMEPLPLLSSTTFVTTVPRDQCHIDALSLFSDEDLAFLDRFNAS